MDDTIQKHSTEQVQRPHESAHKIPDRPVAGGPWVYRLAGQVLTGRSRQPVKSASHPRFKPGSLHGQMSGQPLPTFGSLGSVRRAGDVLRRAQIEHDHTPSPEEIREARGDVEAYRSAHAAPLRAAYMGLRSCLTTEGLDLGVSRRLKRLPTIEDKLRRLPKMDLSTMQDIGGCRAVLNTQQQVQQVMDRFRANSLQRNEQPDKIKDYVAHPQPSGYRAAHIYTRYHGRRNEVQLRTPGQDSWAKIVEDLTGKTGIDFKSGDSPDEVHDLLRTLSELLSQQESGQPPTKALMDILTRLAMMSVPGLAIRPFRRGAGED